jgi:hypothetical protein
MIVYKLICKDCEISFDSWFSSLKEYEKLKKKKFIKCHACNSLNVEKTLMSPSILRIKNNTKINNQNQKYKERTKTSLEYQNFIKKNFDNVGKKFAYEARSMHYNNKKTSKGIYGTATREDLKELNEEGIEVKKIFWIKNIIN